MRTIQDCGNGLFVGRDEKAYCLNNEAFHKWYKSAKAYTRDWNIGYRNGGMPVPNSLSDESIRESIASLKENRSTINDYRLY